VKPASQTQRGECRSAQEKSLWRIGVSAHVIHFIPEDRHASIKKIQIATDNTYHFITTLPSKPHAMVILVTNTTINLGMGWAGLKHNLDTIAPLCP
jgi:hypothetical protein